MDQQGNLVCVDLFAGCGGLSLGLEMSGFRPLLFCEINKAAGMTYLVNRPEMSSDQWIRDIEVLLADGSSCSAKLSANGTKMALK